jgi:hypothetical protein
MLASLRTLFDLIWVRETRYFQECKGEGVFWEEMGFPRRYEVGVTSFFLFAEDGGAWSDPKPQ